MVASISWLSTMKPLIQLYLRFNVSSPRVAQGRSGDLSAGQLFSKSMERRRHGTRRRSCPRVLELPLGRVDPVNLGWCASFDDQFGEGAVAAADHRPIVSRGEALSNQGRFRLRACSKLPSSARRLPRRRSGFCARPSDSLCFGYPIKMGAAPA
jgi:hypothetical protein